MVVTEMIMQHLSTASNMAVDDIRTKNFYKENDITHFGQRLLGFNIPIMFRDIYASADVAARRRSIEEFNKENRWRKRGLCVLPTKFGINFTAKFMNQGGALVHVYTDGSVLIAHGGTEMGQGLNTKLIQVAAQCFGISHEQVFIEETSTNTVANAIPTAASASTDLYGMAVLDACEQILERLEPFKVALGPDVPWGKLVAVAFFERINLSAQGFYIIHTKRCGFDWANPPTGEAGEEELVPFNYFTQGVAATEVEIDCLTGDSKLCRVDILMDCGDSINPALDIGQIEGAFMQGYGWSTMEELMWGDKGHPWIRPGQLFTRGPGTYKIPSFNDVPQDFRTTLALYSNKFAVHSSKATGEPPFFMGSAAFFAIQDCIDAAREENTSISKDDGSYYSLDLPASSERIRMACADEVAAVLCQQKGKVGEGEGEGKEKEKGFYYPKGSW